jgi:hypothetical protein
VSVIGADQLLGNPVVSVSKIKYINYKFQINKFQNSKLYYILKSERFQKYNLSFFMAILVINKNKKPLLNEVVIGNICLKFL